MHPLEVLRWPDLLVSTCLKYLEWRYRPAGEPDLGMAGLVPPETQQRWHNKIGGMRFDLSWQERIAERTTTDVPRALRRIAAERRAAGLPAEQQRG